MEKRSEPIELKNEELNEVLSAPPFWLVRSGNTLFFFVIILILGLSYIIRYPDEISGQIALSRERAPVTIQNQTDGKLSSFYVHDGQWVQKGKLLAVFESRKNRIQRLVAPVNGRILLDSELKAPSSYKANGIRITVDPEIGKYRGIMCIPGSSLTKIRKGQSVFIELSDYPKSEFGMLEGKVRSIASLPKKDKYEITIELPQQLHTTYKNNIPEKVLLKGDARIITNNKRLLERVFENILTLF